MNAELREHVHLLLQREPTRSLPLRLLRERLRPLAGGVAPREGELRQALQDDPRLRLLDPPPLPEPEADTLRRAGLLPEPCVALLEERPPGAAGAVEATRTALLELLEGRPGLEGEVAQALGELAQLGALLGLADEEPDRSLRGAGAARSTSRPRAPRARRRSRRESLPPA